MIKRFLCLLLLLALSGLIASYAADDPMKSLFLFQKQMADAGNASAMMKLGQMYEHGEGVKQSNANALKMYEKASAAGHAGADEAIKRVKNSGKNSAKLKIQEEKRRQEALERKKAEAKQKELARKKAEEKKLKQQQQAAKEKKAREKEAREKAAADELARKRNQDKIKAAKLKAERLRAEKARAAAAKEAADEAKAKQIRMLADEKRRKEQQAVAHKQESSESFKADPCKSPAARLMSICKNK